MVFTETEPEPLEFLSELAIPNRTVHMAISILRHAYARSVNIHKKKLSELDEEHRGSREAQFISQNAGVINHKYTSGIATEKQLKTYSQVTGRESKRFQKRLAGVLGSPYVAVKLRRHKVLLRNRVVLRSLMLWVLLVGVRNNERVPHRIERSLRIVGRRSPSWQVYFGEHLLVNCSDRHMIIDLR